MMRNKGNFYFVLIGLIITVVSVFVLVMLGMPALACLVTAVGLSCLIILGEIVLVLVYNNIRKLRIKTDNIVYYNNGNYDAKEDRIGDDRYLEGEIGKLNDSIASLVSILSESKTKELREKEFLRDIISDISHQLKTPIAALTVFNDIFMNDNGAMSDDEKKDILIQSEQQLERMKWLIQAMLQLARIEACSIIFSKNKINVRSLLESCTNMLLSRANEKSQELNIECEDNIFIHSDSEWLQEALVNIIKNAIDYSPSGGEIFIGAKQTPISTKIWVKDYGPGIEEKDRINIFKRFYRAKSNQVNPNSVGIGLALAKSIVEGCGGSIRVESLAQSECGKDEQSFTKMVITF